jgi:hypothetical protein
MGATPEIRRERERARGGILANVLVNRRRKKAEEREDGREGR